jgi:hypothetical protein
VPPAYPDTALDLDCQLLIRPGKIELPFSGRVKVVGVVRIGQDGAVSNQVCKMAFLHLPALERHVLETIDQLLKGHAHKETLPPDYNKCHT